MCEIARGREPLYDVTKNFLSVFPFLLSLCKSQKGPLFIILCILFLSHSFISHLSPPSFLSIFFISSVFHRSVPNRFGCFLYFFFLFLSISIFLFLSFPRPLSFKRGESGPISKGARDKNKMKMKIFKKEKEEWICVRYQHKKYQHLN